MAFADAQANAVVLHGETEGKVKLAGTVSRGDAVGYSAGWKRALATVGSVVQMRCVASEDGVTGQVVSVYFGNTIVGGGRFTGATAAGALYVAEGTSNGMYTQTIPSTTGDSTKQVGSMLDATTALLTPNANVDSTA